MQAPDIAQLTRLIDELRGGPELREGRAAFRRERDLARFLDEHEPGARRAVSWHDRFTARAAELAVTAGLSAVFFGGAGFPGPDGAPHRAAALASPAARFFYTSPSSVVAAFRGRALAGDRQAAAIHASSLKPRHMVTAAAGSGFTLNGPAQVQLGYVTWALDEHEIRLTAVRYKEVLHRGSQLVMTSAEAAPAIAKAVGSQMYAHPVSDLAAWVGQAGLTVGEVIPDVRTWGRNWEGAQFERLGPGGRVSAVIAVVP